MSRAAKVAFALAVIAVATVPLVRRQRRADPEHVIRSYLDAWAEGDDDALDDVLADDYQGHRHTVSGTEDYDREELAARIETHAQAFDRVDYDLEQVVASDGEVACRINMRAHHRETRRDAETSGLAIFRLKDGKIAEEWSSWDYLGLAEQLGISSSG